MRKYLLFILVLFLVIPISAQNNERPAVFEITVKDNFTGTYMDDIDIELEHGIEDYTITTNSKGYASKILNESDDLMVEVTIEVEGYIPVSFESKIVNGGNYTALRLKRIQEVNTSTIVNETMINFNEISDFKSGLKYTWQRRLPIILLLVSIITLSWISQKKGDDISLFIDDLKAEWEEFMKRGERKAEERKRMKAYEKRKIKEARDRARRRSDEI